MEILSHFGVGVCSFNHRLLPRHIFSLTPLLRSSQSQPAWILSVARTLTQAPVPLLCSGLIVSHVLVAPASFTATVLIQFFYPPTHPVSPFLFVITLLLLRAFKLHLNLFSQLHIFLNNSCIYRSIVSSLILVL